MSSIYEIESWAEDTDYKVNNIVLYNGVYYYSNNVHDSGSSFDPSQWNGTALDINGDTKPHFFWKPSYNSPSPNKPKVNLIKFGDGYEQRIPNGINNNLKVFNFIFGQRKTTETKAILHFLDEKKGSSVFLFTPPAPYNDQRRFVCREWQDTPVFFDNTTITAKFEEVTA